MDLFNIRRDFTLKALDESDILSDPIEMLKLWINNAIEAEALEPTAMTLSTVSIEGKPSSRVVLLKELNSDGLTFFTNYSSKKGVQIAANKHVAVNFIWHELERQVRVEGIVAKLNEADSNAYYSMRPKDSQIGAWASPQSQIILGREYLDEQVKEFTSLFSRMEISKPPFWGGYIIQPQLFEFWQGRKNRLHDRIQYTKSKNGWTIDRLAP